MQGYCMDQCVNDCLNKHTLINSSHTFYQYFFFFIIDSNVCEEELIEKACTYVTSAEYPVQASKNERRSIRRKAKKFSLKHGDIHYTRTNGSEVSFEH